ncbi:MAG: FAD-dependent oxidoreductase [Candidatus Aenigmarchaeota archaeon]|nr:FAD-dependent oxidoreductase [Candidatus Aenigmarchaeota archaeon]
MEGEVYDIIIVGSGPAGLTAAVYAGRYLMKTLVIGELSGGMISEAHKVCNFPTYKSISGMELTQKMVDQVKSLGVEIRNERTEEVRKNDVFEVKTTEGVYHGKTVILATGTEKRKLDIKGEKEFLGKGVSYCATCDAGFFKDKTVAIVGGSDAALTAALLLAEYAKKVYIIYRKDHFFRAEPAWIKQVEAEKKIEPVFNSNITEIKGGSLVESIKLDTGKELAVDGVFVEIGLIPITELAEKLDIKLEKGHIVVDRMQRTSVPGIFAAGDITNNPLKQAITAAAEGAIAATTAYEKIKGDG